MRRFLALALICAAVAGCSKSGRISHENDRLRRANLEMSRRIEQLERDIQLRHGELEAMRQQAGGARAVEGADLPQLSALKFDRYSGAIDTNGDGIDDRIRIYARPMDQQGRVLVVTGRAHVQAVVIEPNREPRLLAERIFEPAEFDKTYRSGITGTHYTLELPLPLSEASPPAPRVTHVTVKMTFTEAATGVQASHEQAMVIEARPSLQNR